MFFLRMKVKEAWKRGTPLRLTHWSMKLDMSFPDTVSISFMNYVCGCVLIHVYVHAHTCTVICSLLLNYVCVCLVSQTATGSLCKCDQTIASLTPVVETSRLVQRAISLLPLAEEARDKSLLNTCGRNQQTQDHIQRKCGEERRSDTH